MTPGPNEPRMLGRYELLFVLGQGGMGEVHLAKLTGAAGFEKLCIVKTILPAMQSDAQFVERFHHEARVLVQLNHSNIAQVYDMGEVDGTLYMAIEYVPGVDLARVESRSEGAGEHIPVPIALYLGRQICEGLDYAHRKTGPDGAPLGIVHRDISPHNVMVSYEGEVKVIDFGLAKSAGRSKHTLPATVMGKLGYMSPEQAMARPVDMRSDIYSAAIVVWELLAGRALFNGGTMPEMMAMMANPTIPSLAQLRPDVSPTLDAVVARALQKDPLQRYSRAEEFARGLNEIMVREGLQVSGEEVGNYVRARCAEEFAAERKLQSQLSVMRRKKVSGGFASEPAAASRPSMEEGIDGTLIRSSKPEQLTPAQRALSQVAGASPSAPGARASQLRQPATPGPSSRVMVQDAPAQRPPSQPIALEPTDPSAPVVAPRSKAPLVVAGVVGLLALAGAGVLFWPKAEPKVEPKPEVKLEPAKPLEPLAEVKKPVEAPTEPAKPAEPVAEAKAEPKPEPIGTLEVKKTPFKVLREDGKSYVILPKGERVAEGDTLQLVGMPKEGSATRDVFGTAAVLEVKKNVVTLLIDKDLVLPQEVFGVAEVGAKVDRTHVAARVPKAEPTPEKPAEKAPEKVADAVKPEATGAIGHRLKDEDPFAKTTAGATAAKVEPVKAEAVPEKALAAVQPAMAVKEFPTTAEKGSTPPSPPTGTVTTATPAAAGPGTAAAGTPAGTQAAGGAAPTLTAMVRVTNGMFGGRQVYVNNTNRFTLSGCQIRLPDNRAYTFAPREILQQRQEMGFDYARFINDGRPPHPGADKGMALVWCREGYTYVKVRFER